MQKQKILDKEVTDCSYNMFGAWSELSRICQFLLQNWNSIPFFSPGYIKWSVDVFQCALWDYIMRIANLLSQNCWPSSEVTQHSSTRHCLAQRTCCSDILWCVDDSAINACSLEDVDIDLDAHNHLCSLSSNLIIFHIPIDLGMLFCLVSHNIILLASDILVDPISPVLGSLVELGKGTNGCTN